MNKKQKKRIKISILICSLVIPMGMLFGFLIPNGKADEPIPIDPYINPRNKWHWNVSTGDLLIYELELTFKSLDDPTMVSPMKDIQILEIESFENQTIEYLGEQEMSIVWALEKFYNPDLPGLDNKDENPIPLAFFGFDETHPYYPEKYGIEAFILIPVLLPINGTNGFEADVMVEIINNTFYSPWADMGVMTEFDEIGNNTAENKIWFKDNDDGYYINASYYDNGTLKNGEAEFLIAMESSKPNALFKFKMERVFNYNVTDEIEWGVKADDTFYMGMAASGEGESFFNETKIDITEITHEYGDVESIFDDNGGFPLEFEVVYANVSFWDGNKYVLGIPDAIIGIANNFYPQYYPYMIGMGEDGGEPLLIMPNNTNKEDLSFWWNNMTSLRYFYTEARVTDNSVELTSFFSGLRANMIFDEKTGLAKLFYITTIGGDGNGDGPSFFTFIAFQKNDSVVPAGENNLELWSELVGNNKVEINFTTSEDNHIYWAVIPENPLGDAPIPSSNPDLPLFIDVYANGTAEPIGTPNMTIYYDPAQLNDIPEEDLVVYWANIEEQKWEIVDQVIDHDIANNKFIVNLTYQTYYYALGNKDMTSTVNWSVKEDDEIYVGINGRDYGRAIVTKINITTYNMTEIMPFRIPGLPEIMNFSTIYGNLTEWEIDDEKWSNEVEEGALLAAANNYMPIGPMFFGAEEGGAPILMPNGTTGEDLKSIFGIFINPYFDQVYGTDYIILSDPSSDAYIKANFSVEDGRITFMRGWFPDDESGYDYFSFYILNMTVFNTSPKEEFFLYPELVDPNVWRAEMNLTFTPDIDFGWAVLPDNPTNSTLWNFLPENISLYIHFYVSNTTNTAGNFSIYYNKAVLKACGLNESDLVPYMFDLEYNYWKPLPDSEFILDKANDRLIVIPYGGFLFTIGTDMLSQVEWYNGEGEIFYLGTMQDEIKVQIHEINVSSLYNMTELTGIDMEIFGFPDNQTFSNVWADVWNWNTTTDTWDYGGLFLIAAANNYWPFAPNEYFEVHKNNMGIPFIMPKGTTGKDMAYILEVTMKEMMYDTIVSGTEFVYLSNSSYYVNFSINSETGIIRNIWGYHYENGKWVYISFFFKYNETLGSGHEHLDLNNYFIPSIDMYVEIDSSGCEFLYALLSANPTDKSTPSSAGIPIFYIDVMILNKTTAPFDINVTIILPSEYNIGYINTECYWDFNKSQYDERKWVSYAIGGGATVIKDYSENSLTIIMENDKGPILSITAFMYTPPSGAALPSKGGGGGGGGGEKEAAVIPGYDLTILITIIAFVSVTLTLKRRKIKNIFKK